MGDVSKNAELAKQRALVVRDALKNAGMTNQQIDLEKPGQMTASGSDAESHRMKSPCNKYGYVGWLFGNHLVTCTRS